MAGATGILFVLPCSLAIAYLIQVQGIWDVEDEDVIMRRFSRKLEKIANRYRKKYGLLIMVQATVRGKESDCERK